MSERVEGCVVGIDPGVTSFGLAINMQAAGDPRVVTYKLATTNYSGRSFRGCLEVFNSLCTVLDALEHPVSLIAIEGKAFREKHNHSALWHIETLVLMLAGVRGYPIIVVPPTSIKRFIMGKGGGRASKDEMKHQMLKEGLYAKDHNIQDAICAAHLGLAKLMHDTGDERLEDIYNEDQVTYLRKQFKTKIETDFYIHKFWPKP